MRMKLTLPSGRQARVTGTGDADPIEDDDVDGKRTFAGRFLNALREGAVVIERREGAKWSELDEEGLLSLSLPDFHALRDAAFRVGAIAVPDRDYRCRNCERPLPDRPDAAPFDDLDRWYETDGPALQGPFALGVELEVPGGTAGTAGTAGTVDVEPVTARRALPLFRAVMRDGDPPERTSPALVRALGVRALGNLRDPKRIARVLDEAPDEVWDVIETAYVHQAYSPRAHYPRVCEHCGAVHDVDAPSNRELEPDPDAEWLVFEGHLPDFEAGDHDLPDLSGFEAAARRIGADVYRDRGVRNIDLIVHSGTPVVDGSGEPLMGSYQPVVESDTAGYSTTRFVITLYYKTFEKMWDEAPYDVLGEIRETIDHEVEHHLYHLAGHDPMDEEERVEALEELKRTFGERAVRRARVRGVVADAKRIGIFAVLVALGLGVMVLFLYATGRL